MKSDTENDSRTGSAMSPTATFSQIKHKLQDPSSFTVKDAIGLALSLWPLRRYPRLTIMGLIAAGVYIGVTRSKAKRAAKMGKVLH